jgi:hypothetical protein
MAQVENAAELDAYLLQVVQALHRTVKFALPRLKDDKEAGKALADCDEILGLVLEGRVSEWLA